MRKVCARLRITASAQTDAHIWRDEQRFGKKFNTKEYNMQHTKAEKNGNFTPIEKKWIMYDVGNSAFTLLCSVFIPIIVQALCAEEGMSDTEYQTFWSTVTSVITLAVAVISPIVGTFADSEGMKKPLFWARR